ncbi:hypothetical protein JL720_16999 [Aureococcus anophagefferens]|nr:hypothetical protein JL720_16999 [Aureococcus anophagefferens]
MATMSFVVMGIRMATGHLMLRRFFYFISVIQFLFFALIVIQTRRRLLRHNPSIVAREKRGDARARRRRGDERTRDDDDDDDDADDHGRRGPPRRRRRVPLAVDLSLSSAFTPLQRIVLTANGNLQRILSAHHNRAVTVTVLRNERVKIGLWRRRVLIAVDGTPACVAASVVTAVTREAIELADGGGVGIGQIFAELGGKQSFSLLEVSKNATTFSRTYTLANAHIMCHVEEVLPLNLFDDDFFGRAPDWHPDAALQ